LRLFSFGGYGLALAALALVVFVAYDSYQQGHYSRNIAFYTCCVQTFVTQPNTRTEQVNRERIRWYTFKAAQTGYPELFLLCGADRLSRQPKHTAAMCVAYAGPPKTYAIYEFVRGVG